MQPVVSNAQDNSPSSPTREINRSFTGAPNCTRPAPKPLWQRDYWDRYIRDDHHFQAVRQYIDSNPVTAGLVDTAVQWPWGSARWGDQEEGK